MRRCLRQQLCSGIAKAALIEEEEVEAGEVRCDQGELLAQRSLRQAQRSRDGEPVNLDVEEHERTLRRARSRPATRISEAQAVLRVGQNLGQHLSGSRKDELIQWTIQRLWIPPLPPQQKLSVRGVRYRPCSQPNATGGGISLCAW